MTPNVSTRPLFDAFNLSADTRRMLYADVLGQTAGPSATALAYRTHPTPSPPVVLTHAVVVLHRSGCRRIVLRCGGRGTACEVTSRCVSLYPTGWEVTPGYREPGEGLLIGLTPRLLADVAGPLGVAPVLPPLWGIADDVLDGICETLWRSPGAGASATDALARAAATHALERYAPRRPAPPGWMQRTERFIHENLTEALTVEQLAAAAGLSRAHFSRLFKHACGRSPHAFVLRRRIDRAKELLRAEPDLPLAQVAAKVGFCDQGHLTRRFRQVTGLTPAAYRAQIPHERPNG